MHVKDKPICISLSVTGGYRHATSRQKITDYLWYIVALTLITVFQTTTTDGGSSIRKVPYQITIQTSNHVGYKNSILRFIYEQDILSTRLHLGVVGYFTHGNLSTIEIHRTGKHYIMVFKVNSPFSFCRHFINFRICW